MAARFCQKNSENPINMATRLLNNNGREILFMKKNRVFMVTRFGQRNIEDH